MWMIRATRFARLAPLALFAASTAAGVLSRASEARADASGGKTSPVYVLTVQTDDSDDQAEALTQALRSRVRQTGGLSLLETPQSFETLAIALKCPPKPDAPCLQRIGDQLHADRYVWGTLAKGKPGEVKADLHLWTRGKPDVEAVEAYSDNLKDASDEALRAITGSLIGKLTGASTGAPGTVVVHAGTAAGEVLVDGETRGQLEAGVAKVEVPAGPHTVSVKIPGADVAPQSVSVNPGVETDLTFSAAPANTPGAEGPHSSFPVRKVLEYGAIVVGGGLLIVSGVETAQWISDANQSNSDRQNVPKSVSDVCTTAVNASAQDACQKSKDAVNASTLAWVFGGAGAALLGTGIVLLVMDHGSSETPSGSASATRAAPKRAFDVVPSMGPRGGGIDLRVTF